MIGKGSDGKESVTKIKFVGVYTDDKYILRGGKKANCFGRKSSRRIQKTKSKRYELKEKSANTEV